MMVAASAMIEKKASDIIEASFSLTAAKATAQVIMCGLYSINGEPRFRRFSF